MDTLHEAHEILLQDAVTRDRTTARRVTLLHTLFQERYLTRQQLIARIEGKLGLGCFGHAAWEDTFYRDMKVVKRALLTAGYSLAYSRHPDHPGYYLRGQPAISAELAAVLKGCVAEVDPIQIAIWRKLSFAAKFQQGCSISNLARQVVANRIRQRNPHISLAEATQQATGRG